MLLEEAGPEDMDAHALSVALAPTVLRSARLALGLLEEGKGEEGKGEEGEDAAAAAAAGRWAMVRVVESCVEPSSIGWRPRLVAASSRLHATRLTQAASPDAGGGAARKRPIRDKGGGRGMGKGPK